MNQQGPFDRWSRAAFIALCVVLVSGGVGFNAAVKALHLYLKKEPVDLRLPLTLIPSAIGGWKAVGQDRLVDASILEALGTDKYLDRNYVKEDGDKSTGLNVHLAYYTGMIDTVPHVPDRCMVAAGFVDKTLVENFPLTLDQSGWSQDPEKFVNHASNQPYSIVYRRELTGQMAPVRMPVGDFSLRTVEFAHESRPNQRIFGGYFFIANGRITPTPGGVKALAFDPSEKYAYYCKVQYVYAAQDATLEKFLALVADHLAGLLPELMRCLPDWSEVERRDSAVESAKVKIGQMGRFEFIPTRASVSLVHPSA